MMDLKVKSAVNAALQNYATQINENADALIASLLAVFEQQLPFMEKIANFDAVFDDAPKFDELREVIFDLLMINFFISDSKNLDEDYLESSEWEDIEEQTIDRGTEILNLLLYINECKEEDIKPSLSDFLKEFLLVEEDEFQDEYHIYEEFIANQHLADASIDEVMEAKTQISTASEVYELFVPCMAFFLAPKGSNEVMQTLEKNNANKAFDTALYALLTSFN